MESLKAIVAALNKNRLNTLNIVICLCGGGYVIIVGWEKDLVLSLVVGSMFLLNAALHFVSILKTPIHRIQARG